MIIIKCLQILIIDPKNQYAEICAQGLNSIWNIWKWEKYSRAIYIPNFSDNKNISCIQKVIHPQIYKFTLLLIIC